MDHEVMGLHHVGHVVRDMAEAIECYRRLGFTLPPPAYPTLPAAAGEAPVPFGAANTHAYLQRNFLEVVTVVDERGATRMPPDAELIPLQVPAERLPGVAAAIRRTTANLAASLRRFQGAHILIFDSSDVDQTAVRLADHGIGHGGVQTVRRPVETAEGTRVEAVRFLELDGDDPDLPPGRLPEGRVGFAERGISRPRPDHRNGAVDLVECVLCVADSALAGVERRYQAYLGVPARTDRQTRRFHLDGAALTLIPASALADLLPGERAPALPAFVGYAVAVRDPGATARLLEGSGVRLGRTSDGDIFVPADTTLGVAIIFRRATDRR